MYNALGKEGGISSRTEGGNEFGFKYKNQISIVSALATAWER